MRVTFMARMEDEGVVRSCFTQDIEAHYEGRPPAFGLDALIEQIGVVMTANLAKVFVAVQHET